MLDNQNQTKPGTLEVYKRAVEDLPAATKEFAEEVWTHKAQFVKHVVGEAATAITFGAAMGSLLPAKGPAGLLVAGAFAIPVAIDAIKSLKEAHNEALQPGANIDDVAHKLAAKAISGSVDFGVNMAAGYGGTDAGYNLSRTESIMGRAAQASQRGVLKAENESIHYVATSFLSRGAIDGDAAAAGAVARAEERAVTGQIAQAQVATPGAAEASISRTVFSAKSIEPEQQSLLMRPLAKLARRADQYAAIRPQAETANATAPAFNTYRATFHGHTKFDDGMGTAEENYAKAQAGGLDVSFLTPHNHDGARQGVAPDDPRAAAEAGVPILAQAPEEYASIINAAKAASKPGEFYAGFGVEAGTIGPGGHDHGGGGGDHGGGDNGHGGHGGKDVGDTDNGAAKPEFAKAAADPLATEVAALGAPKKSTLAADEPVTPGTDGKADQPDKPLTPLEAARLTHHGGVNHINIFGLTDSLIVAIRQPHPVAAAMAKLFGRDVPTPTIKDYPDGDYAALADVMDKTTDVTGQKPIVQLNHPRWESNGSTDYGITSFPDLQTYLAKFARPYIRLIEVIKGEALNASPVVTTMKPGDFDPVSYSGYIDMGIQAGPTYGRDSHFGDPGGRPAGTGLLAKTLDEPGVYDAMRNRRTFATTNYADLQGVLTANNDAIYMGTVLDQAASPNLNLKFKVGGNIDPNAKYEINLMADEQIGDGKVAAPMKTVTMSGADLIKANQQVAFDPIQHKLGNSSAYYVQVARTEPGSTTTDHLLTAPIWVEPLSGQTHGLVTKMLVGNGSQVLTSPWVPKF